MLSYNTWIYPKCVLLLTILFKTIWKFIEKPINYCYYYFCFWPLQEKYDNNWWIGRLVKEGSDVGFIPSPAKLELLRQMNPSRSSKNHSSKNSSSSNLGGVINDMLSTNKGGDSGGSTPPTPGMYWLSWFMKSNNIYDFSILFFVCVCFVCNTNDHNIILSCFLNIFTGNIRNKYLYYRVQDVKKTNVYAKQSSD